jgi:hypothetical protein
MIAHTKAPYGRPVAIQSQSSLVAAVTLILLNRVVVAVQTIDGQDLAADEPPQLVHQLGMDKNNCTTDCWISAIDGHACKSSPKFRGLLRPRYHAGPRTVQCFSHPIFLRGSVVLSMHNVGTSVLPGYTTSAIFGVVSYLLFAFAF